MKTFHIHIKGIVQGVGFRPFVYRIALQENLKGWVNNTNDGVHIKINASQKQAEQFLDNLLQNLPPLAVVTGWELQESKSQEFSSFEIVHSESQTSPNLLLTPDVAMCNDCRKELYDTDNRRYQYPFITCTNCGPRYSIIQKLPYDRPHTTMAHFEMCPVCLEEYNNPLERRHYSQTNSCPDCAIEMQLFENEKITENFTDLDYIVRQWQKGKIIAIKGIGGYLLTCDAGNPQAVRKLRQRKQRPVKPFALMYPGLEQVKGDTIIRKIEEKALQSNESPIVLLPIKEKTNNRLALNEITKGLKRLGIMLAYTPLYDLLLKKFGKPIVATSGNITNSTIIFSDRTAVKELGKIADLILMNNREILIPQDDGVIQFTAKHGQKIVLRRSRGKAPVYINPELQISDRSILATGSMLKSVFAFSHKKNIYVSQYLGNTESYDAQLNYEQTFRHLTGMLQTRFQTVVTDKHPDYFATRFGKEIAEKNKIEQIEIQHHKAHFYSVLGEHNLLESKEKIMGVIWDGTGLGTDQNIWGGEFFIYENKSMKRMHHIGEFDFILADKMVKEPRISALAIAHHIKEASKYLQNKFTDTEWKIYQQLLQNTQLKSTSMGRLFDAVSSVLLHIDKHSFEAEASIRLEQTAENYLKTQKTGSYIKNDLPENLPGYILSKIINDLDNGVKTDEIAAKFHLSLADYILLIARKYQIRHLAFSGGVFQNALLVDLIINRFSNEYNLYFQKEFSPNDEGIPFGQLMYANQRINN